MPDNDLFLQTVETVYASGLDSDRLSEALEMTSTLLGAAGATLEVVDKGAWRHSQFCSVGLPTIARTPYMDHFWALNPRFPFVLRQRTGDVSWDRQILDEATMERDAFYAEFLSHLGLRYFVGAVLANTPERLAVVSAQRTRQQGHVDKREIALMGRLMSHYQRAQDVATRLRTAGDRRSVLENTLEWLAEGVALLRANGDIVYANDALCALALRGDGFRISDGAIEFTAPEARDRFGRALGAVARLGDPSHDAELTDFRAPRRDGMPAYIVSVRPLMGNARATKARADIMLLVSDPLWQNAATGRMLQELFSLTDAEAHLAQALCAGATAGTYALERGVSLNTVYSRLKRIRNKSGCKSVSELIRKFGKMNVPLPLNRPLAGSA
jgi:DNA-binding CsgD family transcriptional regulator